MNSAKEDAATKNEPAQSKRSAGVYFLVATLLLIAAVATQFRVGAPSSSISPSQLFERVEEAQAAGPMNVIFILVDTLRADHLSGYGYERSTSPRLDALAAKGIRFARVESQSSWTKASMASLWTGLLPSRNGVERMDDVLSPEAITPAERFRELGYRTVGIWRNGWVAPNFGFGQGFDIYLRPVPGRATIAHRRAQPAAFHLPGTDLDATRAAVEFLRGVGTDPFFLYVHYMDVHQYVSDASAPAYGTRLPDLYDAAVHWTDRNIGFLLDALETSDLRERTLVIVASDHGEALGDFGRQGHARALYSETQHTPLVIGLPFALKPGIVVEEPVSNLDLWPTVFGLLEGQSTSTDFALDLNLDGQDLTPLLRVPRTLGETTPEVEALRNRLLIAELDLTWGQARQSRRPIASALRNGHRLLLDEAAEREGEETEGVQEVSFAPEPGAERLLGDDLERLKAGMLHHLRTTLDRDPLWPNTESAGIDRAERARLRALGYVLTSETEIETVPNSARKGPGALAN